MNYNVICLFLLFSDILEKSSLDFKYLSGQSSSSKKGYQTAVSYQPKKTGPKRKRTRYKEFILTIVRIRLALIPFLGGYIWYFNIKGVTKSHHMD